MAKNKRNQEPNYYFVGKGIEKTKLKRNAPLIGTPNTNIDFYEVKSGIFHRRRKINKFGTAEKDLDAPDKHKSYFEVHDYIDGIHQRGRKPNKKEAVEYNKASKKRRPY